MYQNTLTLNNGVKIQQLGLGTWFIPDDQAAEAVKAAPHRPTATSVVWEKV